MTLPSAPQALDKDQKTLGKGFVECNTRQTAHDIYSEESYPFSRTKLNLLILLSQQSEIKLILLAHRLQKQNKRKEMTLALIQLSHLGG